MAKKKGAAATERAERPKRDYSTVRGYRPVGSPEGAAFFDFDKTLLHGDAGVIYGRSMAKWAYEIGRELSPVARAAFYTYVSGRIGNMLAREVFYRTLYSMKIIKRSRLVELGYRMMAGFPSAYFEDHLERIWEEVLAERLYPEMMQIMGMHRELGQRVVIVSTGLEPIMAHAKKYIGDVDIIACTMHVEGGRFTGKVTGPLYGAHKASAIREYAVGHGVDLGQSYAYSDHYSDEAFLDAVGHPVAINPRPRLRKLAEERGWTVLDLPAPARPKGD